MDGASKKAVEFVVSSYGWGMVQDAANLLSELLDNGLGPMDLIEYVRLRHTAEKLVIYERHRMRLTEVEEYRANARRCGCGNLMNLFAVNDSPCKMVGGSYKSMWLCADLLGCGDYVLSELPARDEAIQYGLKRMAIKYGPEDKRSERRRERRSRSRLRR